MLYRLINLLLLLGVVMTAPLSMAAPLSEATSSSKATDKQLSALLTDLETIRVAQQIPAIGLTLVKNNQLLYADAFGISDINTEQAVDHNSMFRLGSISKTFAGLAALKAQELGYFRLTDSVSQYLGEQFINNPWQQTHPVKIVNLIEHTAGFHDISDAEFSHDQANPIALAAAFEISPQSRTVRWQPGTHCSYSNLGAPILAYIIEQTSGLSYEQFVTRHILQPLGMTYSTYFKDDYVTEHLVTGHGRDGETTVPYWHLAYRPFGALNSTPTEMAAFLQMLINKGQYQHHTLLSDTQFQRLQTPQSALSAQQGLHFGYALGLYTSLFNGITLYGHGGTASGHLADYRYSSKHGLGFAVMININRSQALTQITDRISEFLTKDVASDTTPMTQQAIPDDLSRYEGYYQYASSRQANVWPILNTIDLKRLSISSHHLSLKGFIRSEVELYPTGNGLFRETGQPLATAAFITTDNQTQILQTNHNNFRRISFLHYWGIVGSVAFAIAVVVLGLVYALVWLPSKLLGKLPGAHNTWSRLIPLACVPTLVIPLVLHQTMNSETLGYSLLAYSGYLFVALSAICLLLSTKAMYWRISTLAKVNLTLNNLANVIIGSYLLVWQVI